MSGIIGGLAAGAILLALRSAARNATASSGATSGTRIARYPLAARAVVWVLALISLGVWAILLQVPPDQVRTGVIACSSFTAVVLLLLLEFTCARASWSESGLAYRSPWRKARNINWEDIVEVGFSARLSWILIRSRSGAVIRLPTLLGGLSELLETLKQRAVPALQPSITDTLVFLRIR